jgi:hypothetical protein
MAEAAGALGALAALLRDEGSVVSAHVVDPAAPPVLGTLAAAGPRTRDDAGEYAFVVEAVREGYELHYGQGRVVAGADRDLELLAGDYLYAIGLERLAALVDLDAVRELSDLISLAARLHDRNHSPSDAAAESAALWLAASAAIAAGSTPPHERAKDALRGAAEGAAGALRGAAESAAGAGGFTQALGEASAHLDSRPELG